MIDLSTPNEWQHRDESLGGILFPWYTKSFLDELVTWELSDKVVLEIGMGASTLWWNKKAAWVTAFDMNKEWYYAVSEKMDLSKATSFIPKEGMVVEAMMNVLDTASFDIAIIDCEPIDYRDRCAQAALLYLKPGSKLIIDNWLQPSVGWMPSEETQQLLSQHPVKVYPQEGHPDWKTAVFTIGKVIDNINVKEVSQLENGQYGIGFTTH